MAREPENQMSLGSFDLARGVGMVLILLGHSITPFFRPEVATGLFAGAGSVLGGGIMAMFFMISGFGFYVRSPKRCLSVQTRLLLEPYIYTMGAILLTRLVLALVLGRPFREHGGELVLTYLLGLNAEGGGTLWGMRIESVSILWFILALYGGWICYNGICQLRSGMLQKLLVAFCVVLGWLMTVPQKVWPYCLPMVLLCVGYLAAGHWMRLGGWLERKLPWWGYAIVIGVSLVCAAFGSVNMVACQWRLGLLDVAGSFCVGFLLLRLYRHCLGLRSFLVRVLEMVGASSLWIVFLHGYEKVIFPWHRLGAYLPGAVCVAVCFVARGLLMYLVYRLLRCVGRRSYRKKKVTIEWEE